MSTLEHDEIVIVDGHRLRIVATPLASDEWELYVVNQVGVRSVWFEWFESADAALATGRRAIEEEGVESFVNVEGFDYASKPTASQRCQ